MFNAILSENKEQLIDALIAGYSTKTLTTVTKFPKRRFGKTELQISILTCGGMRFQQNWCPDNLPLLGSRSPVFGLGMSGISSACQENVVDIVRCCLSLGINHFETARFYGTSEMQLADALHGLIQTGELKREDFILQTKLLPADTVAKAQNFWVSSWEIFSKLGYIDLLSVHGLNSEEHFKWVFENGEETVLPFFQSLVTDGHVRHLGFSTHGSPKLVAKIIHKNQFSYVNLHAHGMFGDYHGSGCASENDDAYGHSASIKLAKLYDMGVFIISPFDKGGKLYEPSSTLTSLLNPFGITAIEFQSWYQWWGTEGNVDTIVIGASKPSDLTEVHAAMCRFENNRAVCTTILADATRALKKTILDTCGAGGLELLYKGLPNLDDPRANGIGIPHLVWLWVMVKAFGLYSFAEERFKGMQDEANKWNKSKTHAENILAWNFNPGRCLFWKEQEQVPTEALSDCPDPDRIQTIIQEVHSWFCSAGNKKPFTDVQLQERGWDAGYSLRTWTDFPGYGFSISGVVMQQLTCGVFGPHGRGKRKEKKYVNEVHKCRTFWREIHAKTESGIHLNGAKNEHDAIVEASPSCG